MPDQRFDPGGARSEPMDAFEARLAELMALASEPARRRVDPVAVAQETVTAWPRRSRSAPRLRLVLTVAVIAIALLAAVIGGALLLHRSPVLPLGGAWSTVREVIWSPDGTKLAFFVFDNRPVGQAPGRTPSPDASGADVQSMKDLYVVSADGSDLRRVASALAPGLDWSAPSWSADGRYLAYTGAQSADPATGGQIIDLFTVSVDGSAPVDLGGIDNFQWHVDWSPGGHRLLGTLWSSGGTDVVTVDPDGSNRRQLTSDHLSNDATWSPDGSRILFAHGIPAANGGDDVITPWMMDANGSNAAPLPGCASLTPVWGASGRVWAPDGRSFVCLDKNQVALRVSLDGRTASADRTLAGGWGLRSPDGTRALDWQNDQRPGIFVQSAAGATTQLTRDPHDVYPIWSPGADFVSFWGIRPSGTGLFVVPSQGGPPLLVGPNAIGQPSTFAAWRPASAGPARLAYIRDRSIITVNAVGSDPRVVVDTAAVAAARGAAVVPDAIADRVVLDADGPDRAVYRLSLAGDPVITIENRTNDAWEIGLIDDIGPGEQDCRQVASVSRELAELGDRVPVSEPSSDMVPPVCDILPHTVVRLTDAGFFPRGPLEAGITDQGSGRGYTLFFEFTPRGSP